MTLWQVLLVVAVAWFSGALFGVGWKDLRVRRTKPKPSEAFGALAAALDTAGGASSETASPTPAAAPAADKPEGKRANFWFVDEGEKAARPDGADEAKPAEPAAAERRAADPVLTQDAAAADPTPPKDESLTLEAPVDAPAAVERSRRAKKSPEPAARADASAAGGWNTVSSVRRPGDPPLLAPVGRSKKRGHQSAVAKQIAHWRARDHATQSKGFMFWVEIAVLVLLLIGASWGVVYFATQPVAGLR